MSYVDPKTGKVQSFPSHEHCVGQTSVADRCHRHYTFIHDSQKMYRFPISATYSKWSGSGNDSVSLPAETNYIFLSCPEQVQHADLALGVVFELVTKYEHPLWPHQRTLCRSDMNVVKDGLAGFCWSDVAWSGWLSLSNPRWLWSTVLSSTTRWMSRTAPTFPRPSVPTKKIPPAFASYPWYRIHAVIHSSGDGVPVIVVKLLG